MNIENLEEKDIVKYACISDKTKEIDGTFSVCRQCKTDIDKKKDPKKSENLKLFDFPSEFIDHAVKMLGNPDVKLNKLEAFLLKLIIPFIRIAHCPRGPYVQVKGSLILISSDIKHSLEKILPMPQQILPVKFKRKLSYDGHYIGEFVDTKKVRLFFEFFKKNNHLYKDVFLQNDIIDEFESELELESDQILEACSNTNQEEIEEGNSDDLDDPDDLKDEIDLLAEEDDTHDTDGRENVSKDKDGDDVVKINQQNATLFMNKYEEDTDALTVANRLAKLICHLEKEKVLTVDPLEEMDLDHLNDNNMDFYEPKDMLYDSEGEYDSDEDSDYVPTEDESEEEFEFDSDASLSSEESGNVSCEDESTQDNQQVQQEEINVQKLAEVHTKRAKDKLNAVCVAPGEHGDFVNWKEDVYLEEKCFPELFPLGCGGYLSTCLSTGTNIGFSKYARQKIKSADSKFRDNQSFVFFLLLVKELVELNSCQSTYLRQARNTPGLTKQCLDSTRIHNLTRYNRSFSVFKQCRGTSAYYEAAKKNLMATIRQQGAPNLFVTLTSAEYQWQPLVKSCYEAKYRKPATQEVIENMSEAEKSRLITDNVTLTTLHFEKRIQKLITAFMKPGWFQDDSDPLIKQEDSEGDEDTTPSYFYRIEFQVVHSSFSGILSTYVHGKYENFTLFTGTWCPTCSLIGLGSGQKQKDVTDHIEHTKRTNSR